MPITILSIALQMFIGANSILPVTSLGISDTLYNPAVFESTDKVRLNVFLEATYASEFESEYRFAYDQFNSGIGKISTYSGQFSYIKPANFFLGLTYKTFSLVGGIELYKSFEYEMDRWVYDWINMELYHRYLFSHGGIYGAYAGFGLKNEIFGFGVKFVDYMYRLSIRTNTNFYEVSGTTERKFNKLGFQLFSNINITDRIKAAVFYATEVSFYVVIRPMVFTCPLPFDLYTTLPERRGVELVYLPPSDIVTMASFTYTTEGEARYMRLNFRHNFLNINTFEFGGGLFKDEKDNWGSFLTLGLGTVRGKFGFDSEIKYGYSTSDVCNGDDERTNTLIAINFGLRYRL